MSREAKLRAFRNLGRARGEVRERIRGERLGQKKDHEEQVKECWIKAEGHGLSEEGGRLGSPPASRPAASGKTSRHTCASKVGFSCNVRYIFAQLQINSSTQGSEIWSVTHEKHLINNQ